MVPDVGELAADLGVTVVTQPNFVAERGEQYLIDVPADEHAQLWRVASLVCARIPVAGSTDAPFGALDPWAAMRAAVTRATAAGHVIGPHERVEPRQALQMFLGAGDRPAVPRRIEPGQPGDLCILSVPPDGGTSLPGLRHGGRHRGRGGHRAITQRSKSSEIVFCPSAEPNRRGGRSGAARGRCRCVFLRKAAEPSQPGLGDDQRKHRREPEVGDLQAAAVVLDDPIGDQEVSGVKAMVNKTDDTFTAQSVHIVNLGGFTGTYAKGDGDDASASFNSETFTITGTAKGYNTYTPNESATATFKIVATC